MADEKTIRGGSLIVELSALIELLNEKEKRSILGRFGFSGRKETLSLIGRELKLSRERIRQIEKNSLRKMRERFAENNKAKIAEIIAAIEKDGGIIADENIPANLLTITNNHKFGKNYLRLAFSIIDEIENINETNQYRRGWKLKRISKEKITSTCNKIIDYFKIEELPTNLVELKNEVNGLSILADNFILACINESQKIVIAKNGMIGLKSWPSVNPRNVRDKIYYVLKSAGSPLHFTEITAQIAALKFDKKKVVRATVHNELIADRRFVLIGRGIYALREWGYSDGTVSEVIKNILSNSKSPMSVSEIIDLVNKARKVKKNTIVINLQTKKEFHRVAGGYVYQKL